jgi:hypothetical protein
MRWAVGGTVLTRRLAVAGSIVASLLTLGAVWLGAGGRIGVANNDARVEQATAAPRATDVVTLRFRARERQPATSPGHLCVTDAVHGRICASFSAGERPAASLVQAIESRGLRAKVVD